MPPPSKVQTSVKPKNTKIKQKAGALIGHGAFGCVYTPPLPCADKRRPSSVKSPSKVVSKVFNDQSEMMTEWKMSELIAKMDPQQKYFVYADDRCDVKTSVMDTQSGTCDAVQTFFDDTVPSLRMPYGGHPFHDWLVAQKTRITIPQLVRILLPVFEGLKLMNKHGFVHQDLKPNNLLIDKSGHVRIIDFSFTVRDTDLLDHSINKKVVSSYWVLPVEYRIRRLIAKSPTINDVQRLIETEENLVNHTFKSADIKSIKHLRRYFWPQSESETLIKSSLKRALSAKTSIVAWSAFVKSIDIYSFGLILIWAVQHTSTFRELDVCIRERECLNPIWVAFRELVRHMTCPDVKKRVSITQAIKMAKAIAKMTVK